MSIEQTRTDPFQTGSFVYVRHMQAGELTTLLPPDALEGVANPEDLFIVASSDGQRLAVVEGREAAFAACRANDLSPLSVH